MKCVICSLRDLQSIQASEKAGKGIPDNYVNDAVALVHLNKKLSVAVCEGHLYVSSAMLSKAAKEARQQIKQVVKVKRRFKLL